jgi:hypothetical protein
MAEAEQGTRVEAGPIMFMIEHRTLVQDGTDVSGPTIRVLGADDEHEYLRFDMFNTNAHYHYEPPSITGDEKERILPLDTVAEGEPVAWAMDRLRGRLAPMLTEAGGQRLANALDNDALARAVDEVESLVREAQAAHT